MLIRITAPNSPFAIYDIVARSKFKGIVQHLKDVGTNNFTKIRGNKKTLQNKHLANID